MNYRKSLVYISLMILLIALTPINSTAAVSSPNTLDVSVMRYSPSPAEIGQYVDVWIKIENIGSGEAEDVSIEMLPEYPLALDSSPNAVKNIGRLKPDTAAVHKYRLYVDEEAKSGPVEFDIRYQPEDSIWLKNTFEIKVGSTSYDSKGSIELEEVSAEPEVFSPGDSGTITFSLKNSATTHSVTIDGKEYDTNAHIQSSSLEADEGIEVSSISDTYGLLGPGDKMDITYNLEVDEHLSAGTHYLNLAIKSNSHIYDCKWEIPLKIDNADVKVIPTITPTLVNGKGTIEFDVANIRQNTLYSVNVIPEAEGIEFSPREYFVGTMEPDELFSIQFEANQVRENITEPLEITVEYRNGMNAHQNTSQLEAFKTVHEDENGISNIAVAALALVGLLIPAAVLYRRKN